MLGGCTGHSITRKQTPGRAAQAVQQCSHLRHSNNDNGNSKDEEVEGPLHNSVSREAAVLNTPPAQQGTTGVSPLL